MTLAVVEAPAAEKAAEPVTFVYVRCEAWLILFIVYFISFHQSLKHLSVSRSCSLRRVAAQMHSHVATDGQLNL